MRLTIRYLTLSLILGHIYCLFVPLSLAKEQERLLEASRFLGRGNTFVAAYDSDDATKGNPATLAEPTAKDLVVQIRWIEADTFIGENSLSTIQDVSNINGNGSAIDFVKTFDKKFGKRQFLGLQLMPVGLRIYSFEVSPFVANRSFLDLRNPALPELEMKADTIMGSNLAFGYPLGKNLVLGVNIRPMYRIYFGGDIAFADILDFLPPTNKQVEDLLPMKSGYGTGIDLGGVFKPTNNFRLGIMVENAGYTGFGDSKNSPPPIPQRVSVGSLYRKGIGKSWRWDFMADVQDVVNPQKYDYFRLVHLGTEFGTSYFTRDNDLGVLFGMNEGYLVGGGFLDLWFARFEIVNYAAELGDYCGQRRDRRWAATAKVTSTF